MPAIANVAAFVRSLRRECLVHAQRPCSISREEGEHRRIEQCQLTLVLDRPTTV
jgi:hypothetical protein